MNKQDEILILTNDEGKKCPKCGRNVPYDGYWRKSLSSDTLQDCCKDCQKAYSRWRRTVRKINRLTIKDKSLAELSVMISKGKLTQLELRDYKNVLKSMMSYVERQQKNKKKSARK